MASNVTINSCNITADAGSPLDVYQEIQTWSPVLFGSTVAGAGTYTVQEGFYTIIGGLIHINGTIGWTAHTGTGNMRLNVPLPVRSLAGYAPIGLFASNDVNFPPQNKYIVSFFQQGTSTVIPTVVRDGSVSIEIVMTSTGAISYSGWYLL